ncbi:MAG: hypothetical protein ACYC1Q_11180 [Bacteroidia bacterium]
MKTIFVVFALFMCSFSFAGGMAAGTTSELFLLYGGLILLIGLVIFIPRFFRWIRLFSQHRTHPE